MSKELALTVEILVPLRQKEVKGCLVKFLGLRCDPVPHMLLVVRAESFALRIFYR